MRPSPRELAASFLLGLLTFSGAQACRHGEPGGPGTTVPEHGLAQGDADGDRGMPGTARGSGTCRPSSVAGAPTCPKKTVPPSNASSSSGCKSDAECTSGIDGRCVDTGAGLDAMAPLRRSLTAEPTSLQARRPSNFLAEPPPPPPRTICVYDACQKSTDCGANARCECGEGGLDRNACVALDSCMSDRDCAAGTLCSCGEQGGPNQCVAGNCRHDSDCDDGLTCSPAYSGGAFCHTPEDRCRSDKDCDGAGYAVCDTSPSQKAWACRVIPPRPPG